FFCGKLLDKGFLKRRSFIQKGRYFFILKNLKSFILEEGI
ncbi:hypothetical protein HMPREF3187_01157, partial [Aerococcus christensenii]